MEGTDQRLQLRAGQELDLVEEEDDPRLVLARRLPHRDQQIAQILTELAAVGGALDGVDVDAPGHGSLGADGDRERTQHAGRATQPATPPVAGRDLEQRAPHEQRHPRTERCLGRDLTLDRRPALETRLLGEGPEQHRLPDAPEARDQDGSFRSASAQSFEEETERLDLSVTTDEGGGPHAGTGRIRVQPRIHAGSLSGWAVFVA